MSCVGGEQLVRDAPKYEDDCIGKWSILIRRPTYYDIICEESKNKPNMQVDIKIPNANPARNSSSKRQQY